MYLQQLYLAEGRRNRHFAVSFAVAGSRLGEGHTLHHIHLEVVEDLAFERQCRSDK